MLLEHGLDIAKAAEVFICVHFTAQDTLLDYFLRPKS